MASKNIKELAERIKREFGFEVIPESFERTYAGHWQRSAGAYSWIILARNHVVIGGCEPIRKYIAKSSFLELGERHINEYELFAYSPEDYGYERIKIEKENRN